MRPGVDGAVSHHHHSLGREGFNRFGSKGSSSEFSCIKKPVLGLTVCTSLI